MLLALMTYARLESFTKSHIQASEWVWLMKESERDTFNKAQKICNEADKKKAKDKKKEAEKAAKGETPAPAPTPTPPKDENKPAETPPPSPPPTPAGTGKISLAWFLKKDFREKNKDKMAQTVSLIENIISTQWGSQPFYKNLEKERPNFVPQMLQEMTDSVEKAKIDNPTLKIKSLDDLLFVTWKDADLKIAFSRMLQEGLIYKREKESDEGLSDIISSSPKGYQSLNDFFTTKDFAKIRLWLAPRSLLLALFGDPKTVEEIVKTRESYHKEMKKGSADSKDLSKKLEEMFASRTSYNDLLDYTVTTTKPTP